MLCHDEGRIMERDSVADGFTIFSETTPVARVSSSGVTVSTPGNKKISAQETPSSKSRREQLEEWRRKKGKTPSTARVSTTTPSRTSRRPDLEEWRRERMKQQQQRKESTAGDTSSSVPLKTPSSTSTQSEKPGASQSRKREKKILAPQPQKSRVPNSAESDTPSSHKPPSTPSTTLEPAVISELFRTPARDASIRIIASTPKYTSIQAEALTTPLAPSRRDEYGAHGDILGFVDSSLLFSTPSKQITATQPNDHSIISTPLHSVAATVQTPLAASLPRSTPLQANRGGNATGGRTTGRRTGKGKESHAGKGITVFYTMLEDRRIQIDTPWNEAARAVIRDPRWSSLQSLRERKEAYLSWQGMKQRGEIIPLSAEPAKRDSLVENYHRSTMKEEKQKSETANMDLVTRAPPSAKAKARTTTKKRKSGSLRRQLDSPSSVPNSEHGPTEEASAAAANETSSIASIVTSGTLSDVEIPVTPLYISTKPKVSDSRKTERKKLSAGRGARSRRSRMEKVDSSTEGKLETSSVAATPTVFHASSSTFATPTHKTSSSAMTTPSKTTSTPNIQNMRTPSHKYFDSSSTPTVSGRETVSNDITTSSTRSARSSRKKSVLREKGTKEDLSNEMLSLIQGRLLQWAFVNASAEKAQAAQEREACDILLEKWRNGLELYVHCALLEIHLEQEEKSLRYCKAMKVEKEAVDKVQPVVDGFLEDYTELYEGLYRTTHQLPVSGVNVEMKPLLQELSNTLLLCQRLESTMQGKEREMVEECERVVSELEERVQGHHDELLLARENLTTLTSLDAEEHSLRLEILDLLQEEHAVKGDISTEIDCGWTGREF